MKHTKFPDGWNEERVRKVLAFYEEQTEDEAVAEDVSGTETSETVIRVPLELVPTIRELIAKRKS